MNVHVVCSEKVKMKIENFIIREDISIENNANIVLVERGYQQVADKINIVFDAVDYLEALHMVQKTTLVQSESKISTGNTRTITGLLKDSYEIIIPNKILYIEANGKDVTCSTGDHHYLLKKALYHYENILEDEEIIRINKSQLVNLKNVRKIIPWFNSRFVLELSNGEKLEVSKKFSAILRKRLGI